MSQEKERVTVKLLKAQRDDVMAFLDDHPELGYTSFTDFVADSVRIKISKIKEQKRKEAEKLLK